MRVWLARRRGLVIVSVDVQNAAETVWLRDAARTEIVETTGAPQCHMVLANPMHSVIVREHPGRWHHIVVHEIPGFGVSTRQRVWLPRGMRVHRKPGWTVTPVASIDAVWALTARHVGVPLGILPRMPPRVSAEALDPWTVLVRLEALDADDAVVWVDDSGAEIDMRANRVVVLLGSACLRIRHAGAWCLLEAACRGGGDAETSWQRQYIGDTAHMVGLNWADPRDGNGFFFRRLAITS